MAPALLAQSAVLTGLVRHGKEVVPGTEIILKDGGGTTHRGQTDGAGEYRFDNLSAGAYEVSFTHDGYRPLIRKGTLKDGTQRLDVTLEAVSADAAAGEADARSPGRRTIQAAPLPSRRY
jgi:hypothetical protein